MTHPHTTNRRISTKTRTPTPENTTTCTSQVRDRPSWVLWWVRVRWYQSTHEAVVASWSSQPLQARIHTSRACRTRSVPLAVKTTASYRHGKIILIDGIQLISLMLDYGVAVQKVRPVHGVRDRRELLRRLSGLTSDPLRRPVRPVPTIPAPRSDTRRLLTRRYPLSEQGTKGTEQRTRMQTRALRSRTKPFSRARADQRSTNTPLCSGA